MEEIMKRTEQTVTMHRLPKQKQGDDPTTGTGPQVQAAVLRLENFKPIGR